MKINSALVAVFGGTLLLAMQVGAQTPPAATPAKAAASAPAKAAAKPVAKAASRPTSGKAKTLSGKNSAGNLLTRDELRQCMTRLDAINLAIKDSEQQRATLDGERAELLKEGEELKVEREASEQRLKAVREWQERMKAHGAEVEAFNKKAAGLDDVARSRRDAFVAELEAERVRLKAAREVLTGEEARLVPAYQDGAKAYNARAEARDAKVVDWNRRNAVANEAKDHREDDRKTWLSECANRPYREEDEIAVKAGK
jgi:hypothetical protein